MGHRFLEIVGTPAVHAAQSANGSRRSYARMEGGPPHHDRIGDAEAAFIAARDSFYIASVSSTGWPYMQHRGGASGFLSVLSPELLAFPDYPGNKQYVTLGNTATNDRVALFLMDYAARRRLKILGRIAVGNPRDHAATAPDRQQTAVPPSERSLVVYVEAFDWNCPQYITLRFTGADGTSATAALQESVRALTVENERLRAALATRKGNDG